MWDMAFKKVFCIASMASLSRRVTPYAAQYTMREQVL